jgi:hypothetical protein
MAILTELRGKSPEVTVDDLEVIVISGDDADDTDEEYEFEDVLGVDTTASMVNPIQPGAEEDSDDDDGEGIPDGAANDAKTDIDAVARAPEAEHDWKLSDALVAPDTTLRDDRIEEPDSVVYNDGDNNSTVEAVYLDHNGVDSGTSTTIVEVGNTVRDLAVEDAALRDRLVEVETQLHLSSVACLSTSPSKKRKRSAPTSRKRVKVGSTVNISATRAYVYWNDSSGLSTYTWKRGRGHYCWVSDEKSEKDEEIPGEYLLCYATSMSIEVRANADWFPIELRYNEDTQRFEGQASFGRRRLEADCSVVMDMMCGGKGEHVALVSHH